MIRTLTFGHLLRLRMRSRRPGALRQAGNEEPPLRSELFSADQMEQHGKRLATMHKLNPRRTVDQLLARLAENESVLVGACNLLTTAVKANRRITPAAEWLLDNFYLIEEQIRTARRHFPRGYSRELPRLLDGPSTGLPRVYDIALEAISHGDGRVDLESLGRFVAAYQTITALKLGELWAIPIMLRLALIENLRRVAVRMTTARGYRSQADSWADQIREVAEKDPKNLILVIADMARSDPPMVGPFVAELVRRLQGQGLALALPLTWIEQRLSESDLTIEQLVQTENQQQATDQVSISNSIGSLRFLGATDWREFVENMSVVNRVLREDPGGAYDKMDFATRDRYRHVLEGIAKSSRLSEADVAREAIHLARAGAASVTRAVGKDRADGDDRRAHVGFYLIDKGLSQLEEAADVDLSKSDAARRLFSKFPLFVYLGSILLVTVLFTGTLLAGASIEGSSGWILALIGVLSLLSASQLAVALINWLATLLATPQSLPRMDFSEGIPPESRTLVVVPTMLINAQNIEKLIEELEIRFLANRDDNLHFGLLTDFRDAHEETTAEDGPLLALARKGIEDLNQKYTTERGSKGDTFFLFHRPRQWNPQERLWMGYERKRGKLAELNSLLRGAATDRFSLVIGATAVLSKVKYVITLDTDTQLPRDSARQFAGTMAHPLNRAKYDELKQRVVEGYGILQPGVGVSLRSANWSRYARLCGSEPGIDPYTRTVSDVYQDLFGEGSFIGKGIYDVDAFRRALDGRLPENRILSHDLLEGCYVRSGLMSDVQLYEDYPSRYAADVSRRRRWIRGDWQIAGWVLPYVPGPNGASLRNPLSALSRWKIFDNLRRSLVPAALIAVLLLAWTVLALSWFWTLMVIGIILIPPLLASIADAFRKPQDVMLNQHLMLTVRAAGRRFAHAAFALACLPHEAFFSLRAFVRATWRVLVSHRKRLEWTPSSELDKGGLDLIASFGAMWSAPVLALATAAWLIRTNPSALAVAAPILCFWFGAPIVAWWISRPLVPHETKLSLDQIVFLRTLARKTWAYFETLGGAEDHWLPPDNIQEHPVAAIAHRTSPTNIGLALLENLAAYDFGYLPVGQVLERIANTLGAMDAMQRHNGHCYNWYDTQSLEPLSAYVSTVDSGNLGAHLLTLRRGVLALADARIMAPQWLDGVHDTFAIVANASDAAHSAEIAEFRQTLQSLRHSAPDTLTTMRDGLVRLATCATKVAERAHADPDSDASDWADKLVRQCGAALDELTFLTPWTALALSSDAFHDSSGSDAIPTLRELAARAAVFSQSGEATIGLENPIGENARNAEVGRLVQEGSRRAQERIETIERLAMQAGEFANMDYDFLFDRARRLLTIGYNVAERRPDASYYDLLASEARLGSFVAIAQGQVPQENWFALGRVLTGAGGASILLSWSGSMFEYLMPLLVMPTFANTLLDQTYRAAVQRQIEYGKRHNVPWGISESGYNTVDVGLNYQYRAFWSSRRMRRLWR